MLLTTGHLMFGKSLQSCLSDSQMMSRPKRTSFNGIPFDGLFFFWIESVKNYTEVALPEDKNGRVRKPHANKYFTINKPGKKKKTKPKPGKKQGNEEDTDWLPPKGQKRPRDEPKKQSPRKKQKLGRAQLQDKLEGDFTLEDFESDEDFAKHLARNGYEDLSRLLEMSDEFSLGKRDVRHIKRLVDSIRTAKEGVR